MTLVFLKLGGSLITDKTHPYIPRPEMIDTLAGEIADAIRENKDLHLVLGHGSGSFGHVAGNIYDTRRGVSGARAWRGFTEVWYQASVLNRMVVDGLHRANLPALTISPVASVTAKDGNVISWDPYPIQSALSNNLLPVIHGDVAFDEILGGTILSTEDLLTYLAYQLHPQRILLAGFEAGVWADFPTREHLLAEISPDSFSKQATSLGAATGTDVTGGMYSKVTGMLALLKELPALEILIFSGEEPGNLYRALQGENPGTRLHR